MLIEIGLKAFHNDDSMKHVPKALHENAPNYRGAGTILKLGSNISSKSLTIIISQGNQLNAYCIPAYPTMSIYY